MPDPVSDHVQTVRVYPGIDLRVMNGANAGDGLSFAAELDLDDIYQLSDRAQHCDLAFTMDGVGPLIVAPGSDIGAAGAEIHLDSCLTFMSGNGRTTEVIVMVEVDAQGNATRIYGMPLVGLQPKTDYTLVGIETDTVLTRFAQVACVSFTRGTHVTMATGAQRRIETLRPGELILTRDEGPQPLRWLGHSTLRAVGAFAPVRIAAGALNNENDLLVSPDHRLFIYQRSDAIGAGRPEVLVRARHLVNGDSVRRESGGFVDYFQLLFDRHQIIYAEGIAAETLFVDPRSSAALPADLQETLLRDFASGDRSDHARYEIGQALLDHPDAAALLKRASMR